MKEHVIRWFPALALGLLFVVTTAMGSPPTGAGLVIAAVIQALWIGIPWGARKAGQKFGRKESADS